MQVLKTGARRLLGSTLLWTLVGTALRVGSGVITLPIALRTIPSADFGLYYTFLGMTGMAVLLDFGFAQAVTRNAAFAMGGAREFKPRGVPDSDGGGEPNWQLLASLVAAVGQWYRTLGVLMGILLMTLGSWFVQNRIAEAHLPSSYLGCWLLFALSTSYGFVTTYWPDLLIGIGSVRTAARIGIVSQLIGLSLLVAGLLSGWGLWAYAVSTLVAAGIGRAMAKMEFKKHASAAFENRPQASEKLKVLKSLWPMVWRQGIVMIGAFLIQRGNTLVCSAKLGLNETGSYGLSLNLLNLLLQVAVMPLAISWPMIGRMRVQRDYAGIRRLFGMRLYAGLLVGALGILGMGFFGPAALQALGSHTTLLPLSPFLLLGLVMWLEYHHSQYASLVLTENENPFVWPAILSGAAIFALSWWATGRWGVWGLVIAQGVVQLLWNNWWTVLRGMRGLASAEVREA